MRTELDSDFPASPRTGGLERVLKEQTSAVGCWAWPMIEVAA